MCPGFPGPHRKWTCSSFCPASFSPLRDEPLFLSEKHPASLTRLAPAAHRTGLHTPWRGALWAMRRSLVLARIRNDNKKSGKAFLSLLDREPARGQQYEGGGRVHRLSSWIQLYLRPHREAILCLHESTWCFCGLQWCGLLHATVRAGHRDR